LDLASIVGLSFSIIVVVFGMLLGGDMKSFYDPPSILIVLGGTLGAAMVANPLECYYL
jgi:chemotaxis protein MotA